MAARRQQLIQSAGIQEAEGYSAPSLDRQPAAGSGSAAPGKKAGAPTPDQREIDYLGKHDSAANRERFDGTYGKGAAEKALGSLKPKPGTDKESDRKTSGEPMVKGEITKPGSKADTKLARDEAPAKKTSTAGVSSDKTRINPGDADLSPKPGKSNASTNLSRKQQKTQAQGDFLRNNEKMEAGLSSGNKKYAKYVIGKLTDEYKSKLTKRQREKADALVKKAESIVGNN